MVWVTCAAIGAGTVVIDELEGKAEADGILRHEDDEHGEERDDGGEGGQVAICALTPSHRVRSCGRRYGSGR